jgi:hypothetical protein
LEYTQQILEERGIPGNRGFGVLCRTGAVKLAIALE